MGQDPDFDLLLDYLHGQVDPPTRRRLQARLLAEPELAVRLQSVACEEATIAEWSAARRLKSSSKAAVLPRPTWLASWTTARLPWKIAAGAVPVLLLAVVIGSLLFSSRLPDHAATIVRTEGARFDARQANPLRSRLHVGDRVAVEAGLVEIAYHQGARVVLAGPTEYLVTARNAGQLVRGTVSAEAPPAAAGFSISTPTASVVDLGTQFALAVAADGQTALEVFEGEVQAAAAQSERPAISFRQGSAARFDAARAAPQAIAANQVVFEEVRAALREKTIEASADAFVHGGDHADDQPPTKDRHQLHLKQLGNGHALSWCRKVWIRFDLAGQTFDPQAPATLTLRTAGLPREGHGTWEVVVFGMRPGVPASDWSDDALTWNNAPANAPEACDRMDESQTTRITSGTIRAHATTDPIGTAFSFEIPALGDYLQRDGTVTLMLATRTRRDAVLLFASREHVELAGPTLTFRVDAAPRDCTD